MRGERGVARNGVADAGTLMKFEVGVGEARVGAGEEGTRDVFGGYGGYMVRVCDHFPGIESAVDVGLSYRAAGEMPTVRVSSAVEKLT